LEVRDQYRSDLIRNRWVESVRSCIGCATGVTWSELRRRCVESLGRETMREWPTRDYTKSSHIDCTLLPLYLNKPVAPRSTRAEEQAKRRYEQRSQDVLRQVDLFNADAPTAEVTSIKRFGRDYLPTQILDSSSTRLRVVLESAVVHYRTVAYKEVSVDEEELRRTEADVSATPSTISQLTQALQRSADAYEIALANAGNDDTAELSDIGALAIEQRRIKQELERQKALLKEQEERVSAPQRQQAAPTMTFTVQEHSVTPRLVLEEGVNLLEAVTVDSFPRATID